MSIEKDIQQHSFRSIRQKAMINILFSYGWIMERIKNILAQEDITPQQYNILRILRGSFPLPLSTLQIRERMLDRMSDTSRIVDRLVAKQLAKKTTSSKDRRLVDVILTEKGQDVLKVLDEAAPQLDNIMCGLSDEEAGRLSDLLDKLRSRPNPVEEEA